MSKMHDYARQTFCILAIFSVCFPLFCDAQQYPEYHSPASNYSRSTIIRGELVEDQFLRWVLFVGSLKHSVYKVAKNQFVRQSTIVVDKRPGVGNFNSVQEAVDSVPEFNLVRVVIEIHEGVYTEKVSVPLNKPFITFKGAGSSKTIIQWNDTADKVGSGGKLLGTFSSATVGIDASYFIGRNITFKNSAPIPASGEENKQAVALRISGDASAFIGCQFLGAQDTLYDHRGRHYFQECYVEGSVDFIFGDGLSMYRDCHLHAIGANYEAVTAQSRASPLEDSGFSFLNCKVTGSGSLYLGRAWGTFSRVVYAYTYMDTVVVPKGWYNWGDPKRQGTVYYGQYKCYGPGASSTGRVAWSRELTDNEARPFLDLTFIDGKEWIGF